MINGIDNPLIATEPRGFGPTFSHFNRLQNDPFNGSKCNLFLKLRIKIF